MFPPEYNHLVLIILSFNVWIKINKYRAKFTIPEFLKEDFGNAKRKFMNQKTFEKEMKIAEAHGNKSEKRGLNWVAISFALIILTIIIGVFASIIFVSDKINHKLNEGSNTSGAPIQSR